MKAELSALASALAWQAGMLRQFLRQRAMGTSTAVFLQVGAEVSQVLAFLLPLKVILLASAEGVPSYLTGIVPADQKNAAIAAFALAAVACYVASLVFENTADRLSRRSATFILGCSNSTSVAQSRSGDAIDHFRSFVGVAAASLFAGVMLACLVWIDYVLAASIVATTLALLLLFLFRRSRSPAGPSVEAGWDAQTFVQIASTIVLFTGFLVILIQVWRSGTGGNLAALVGFIILRRLLNSTSGAIRTSIRISQVRPLIEGLFSPVHHVVHRSKAQISDSGQVFDREHRARRVLEALTAHLGTPPAVTSDWLDSNGRPYQAFHVLARARDKERIFVERVFSDREAHRLHHEDHLLQYVEERDLGASKASARYIADAHHCDLHELRPFAGGRSRTNGALLDFLVMHWSLRPDPALVASHATSYRTLPQRLFGDGWDGLALAADTPERQSLLDRLEAGQDLVLRKLDAVPLYFANPDLNPGNLYRTANDEPRILDWGRWGLEPIGFHWPNITDSQELAGKLAAVARARGLDEDALTLETLQFVHACARLETSMNRREYAKAFSHVASILSHLDRAEAPGEAANPAPDDQTLTAPDR